MSLQVRRALKVWHPFKCLIVAKIACFQASAEGLAALLPSFSKDDVWIL